MFFFQKSSTSAFIVDSIHCLDELLLTYFNYWGSVMDIQYDGNKAMIEFIRRERVQRATNHEGKQLVGKHCINGITVHVCKHYVSKTTIYVPQYNKRYIVYF